MLVQNLTGFYVACACSNTLLKQYFKNLSCALADATGLYRERCVSAVRPIPVAPVDHFDQWLAFLPLLYWFLFRYGVYFWTAYWRRPLATILSDPNCTPRRIHADFKCFHTLRSCVSSRDIPGSIASRLLMPCMLCYVELHVLCSGHPRMGTSDYKEISATSIRCRFLFALYQAKHRFRFSCCNIIALSLRIVWYQAGLVCNSVEETAHALKFWRQSLRLDGHRWRVAHWFMSMSHSKNNAFIFSLLYAGWYRSNLLQNILENFLRFRLLW